MTEIEVMAKLKSEFPSYKEGSLDSDSGSIFTFLPILQEEYDKAILKAYNLGVRSSIEGLSKNEN